MVGYLPASYVRLPDYTYDFSTGLTAGGRPVHWFAGSGATLVLSRICILAECDQLLVKDGSF